MELQLSLEVEIRPLRAADLDDLDWDSEQASTPSSSLRS